MKKGGLLHRFSLVSLIAFLLFAAVFGTVVTRSLEQNMLARTEELSAQFVSVEVEREFRGKDLFGADREVSGEEWAGIVRHLNLGPNLVGIRIWNRDHVVLWSDDDRLIGRRFPDDKDLKEALGGKIVAGISDLRKSEQEFLRQHGRLMELHVPIRFRADGTADFVFETYQNLAPLFSDIREQQKIVWLWTFICFISLYFILFGVVRSASKRIDSQTKELEASYQMTREILEKAPFGIYIVTPGGSVEYWNPAMLAISGATREELESIRNVFEHPPYVETGLSDKIRSALKGIPFFLPNVELTSHFARKTTVRNFVGIPLGSGESRKALIFVEDITERTRTERERKKIEARLLQSQKIESIGRLAGGVAHDFNNLLSPILGYSEMALSKLPEGHAAREMIMIVKESAERASDLTRQLLAFGRRQVMEMKSVNLNAVVENITKILQGMIGEDIILELKTKRPLSNILADRGQIEQILMNLVVNARDAMPRGGRLVVETAAVKIDGEFARSHSEMKPGSYVVLTVTDTGEGMSREVQSRIFEPFFTTKESGKGTGLGLATVYGIVKQHDGYIYVYSEPGKGTSFKVYLRACGEAAQEQPRREAPGSGSETVLVVDDDASIRRLVVDILRPLGYRTIAASGGEEALKLTSAPEMSFDVLLTDMLMPDMNGTELVKLLRPRFPGMKVIFMSGYPHDTITGYTPESGSVFIQKPLTPDQLACKLREVLMSAEKNEGRAGPD
jgi:two-component system cell cycle sensor histidine kinase/response regulator CckA